MKVISRAKLHINVWMLCSQLPVKKIARHAFVQEPVRTVCTKFKVDRLNRFCTEAHRALTTRKSFMKEIPLTIKTATASSFKHIFWLNYQLWNFFFKSTFYFAWQVNIWISSGYFVTFSNEINNKRYVL